MTDEPQMLDENGTSTQNDLEERKHMVEAPPCFLLLHNTQCWDPQAHLLHAGHQGLGADLRATFVS